MIRFYLVPAETATRGRGPKYFVWRFDPDPPALMNGAANETRDYGLQPLILVASDLTDPQDTLLSSQPDVTKFADNLDDQLGANLAAMQTALEALKIPANLIVATNTYRQVLRGIMGIFAVAQCMQGMGFDIFGGAITLSTTLSQLPAPARQALTDCVAILHYDATGITGASTIREVLRAIAVQASPSPMLGVTV